MAGTALKRPGVEEVGDAWWNSVFDGTFTLVKLPPNTLGAEDGGRMAVFSATGDDNNKWALVLPQNTVSIAVSAAQVSG